MSLSSFIPSVGQRVFRAWPALVLAVLVPRLCAAANILWDNEAPDSDWSSATNWVGNAVPGINIAIIGSSANTPAYAEITQSGETCDILIVGYLNGNQGTLRVLGGDLTPSGYFSVGHITGSSGSVTQEAGLIDNMHSLFVGRAGYGAFVQNGGTNQTALNLNVGRHEFGTGFYFMNGGVLTVGDGSTEDLVVGNAEGSEGEFVMTDGAVDVAEQLNVGSSGRGAFRQYGGTVTVGGVLNCGDQTNSWGELVLSNATLTVNGDTVFGRYGSGRMRVEDGAVFTCKAASHLAFGWFEGSTGVLTIAGGAVTNTGTSFTLAYYAGSVGIVTQTGGRAYSTGSKLIGREGSGLYVQSGGTNICGSDLRIANVTNSTGRYVMTGGRLEVGAVTATADLYIGNAGNGTMEIGSNATVVVVDDVFVGSVSDSSGTCLLHGGTLPAADAITVRVVADSRGTIRGWGEVAATGVLTMNGVVVADGEDTAQDLIVTNQSSLANGIPNGTSETNGWYASNKGRLVLKDVDADATMYWGDTDGPDLVNSVKLDMSGQGGTLSGALLSTDRTDVPSGIFPIAVWQFSGLSGTPDTLTFRYDHTAVSSLGIGEGDLKLFRSTGAGWQNVTATVFPASHTITAAALTLDGGTVFFAVGREPYGTLVTVR